MPRRKTLRPSRRLPLALLATPWIPSAIAQAPSSTSDLSKPPSTFTTSVTNTPTSSPSHPLSTPTSDSRSPSSISTPRSSSSDVPTSPTLPDFIASSNPNVSPAPQTSKQVQQEDQDNGLVNSYFAILALLILFVFLGVWALHRRKKRVKERHITGRREALARDLDSWARRDGSNGGGGGGGNGQSGLVGRYWGHWRNWSDANARREEGLNERGEAPPVYSPRVETESEHFQPSEGRVEGEAARGLQIPLRTLSREEVPGLKPPEYMETIRSTSPESEEGMVGSATAPPALAHPPPLSRDGNGAVSR
ncbi:MAG: hypothetical protein M1822_000360 [Bathelium mastoideum]|nr:MAG: hypothetical protein M1822_000360 [Bathelium mastoideum]